MVKDWLRTFRKNTWLIKNYLTSVLHVDEKTAARDACRIEHIVSSESLNRLELELVRDSQLKKTGIDKCV